MVLPPSSQALSLSLSLANRYRCSGRHFPSFATVSFTCNPPGRTGKLGIFLTNGNESAESSTHKYKVKCTGIVCRATGCSKPIYNFKVFQTSPQTPQSPSLCGNRPKVNAGGGVRILLPSGTKGDTQPERFSSAQRYPWPKTLHSPKWKDIIFQPSPSLT